MLMLLGSLGEPIKIVSLRSSLQPTLERCLRFGTTLSTPMNFHTEALWREAKVHVDMGMPAIKVISALTRVGATILGKQRDLGTIEPGKLGDIIVLNGNPLYDITALGHVETVVKGGRVMKTKSE